MKTRTAVLMIVAALAMGVAFADPPARVARLNYMSGDVAFQPAGVEDWTDAVLNRPLTTGDRIWADKDARAEMHIGTAAIRLVSQTAIQILNLDDVTTQIKLTEGSLNVHIRRLDEAEVFEVDTPNLAFSLLRPGDYRIDYNSDRNETVVIVRSGQGEVTSGGQAFAVKPRMQARVGSGERLSYDLSDARPMDSFDEWCNLRNTREQRSESTQYVHRDMIGYEDLDDNGTWVTTVDYGPVWRPRVVSPGWAPYRFGHWAWIEPWGWTWVDNAPWGFAPFHYGRWAYVMGSWAWIPGPVGVRPVYAPALVGWVGGARVGVGWFPLGHREIYVPAHRTSPGYATRVNTSNTVVNNVNITNVYNNTRYVNQSIPNAVTAVSQNAMASGRPVAQNQVQLTASDLAATQVSNTAAVSPQRGGVLGRTGDESRRVAAPPPAAVNRQTVSRAKPPEATVPFSQRQEALQATPGRPLDAAAETELRQRNIQQRQRTFGSSQRQTPDPATPQAPAAAPIQQQSIPQPQPQQIDRPNRGFGRRPAEQTPVERTMERPTPRPVERAIERQAERPRERPVERPPVERQIERRREAPAPVQRPERVERPAPAPQPQRIERIEKRPDPAPDPKPAEQKREERKRQNQ
ncbi:MAG: hypothetical protein HYZ37_14395 [Candidatus Solibacter usitatus]|nr:hypothetical protein [Candidatus Solibacter usitatus]